MIRPALAWGGLAVAVSLASGGGWAADPRPLSVVTGGSGASPGIPGQAAAIAPDEPSLIEFVRVKAATSAVAALPLDPGRYIPMPLAEFNAAVAAVGTGAGRLFQPTATVATYELSLAEDGQLTGGVSFEVGQLPGVGPLAMPLGGVVAEQCLVQTAVGTGEAAVFGLPDGRVAVQVTGPGTYTTQIRLPGFQVGRLQRIPLVPALVTMLTIRLPAGLRPIVQGEAAPAALVEPVPHVDGAWRIVVSAGADLALVIQDSLRAAPALACWNRVLVRGRQADVATRAVPAAGWTAADLELTGVPDLQATGVQDDSGRELAWAVSEGVVRISIPDRLIGSRMGLVVKGVVPLAASMRQPVPGWRPLRARWAGCGTEVATDAALAVEAIELEQCLMVTSAEAAAWPLPQLDTTDGPVELAAGGSRMFLEHQSPTAAAEIIVRPRGPAFDTARVTTVDLSPGTVLGRAACDVRVVAGDVFSLTAAVAPGWFIDSVEAVDWQRPAGQREGGAAADAKLEWRIIRGANGNELRIGLAAAATSARRLGLLITGHRPGVPLGASFSLADVDMVRLPGESPELAMLEFRVGPMAVIESDMRALAFRGSGHPSTTNSFNGLLAVEPVTGRLAALAAEAAPRARVRAGERAPPLVARLVRRRPPVEAEVRVAVMARDERVAETFSFACQPVAGEIDGLVVHFSEPMPTGLEWSLIEPATGSLSARRLDPGEAALGAAMPDVGVAESWLVDVRPATAGLVRFVAARTIPLEAAVPIPLAWVEAAEQPGGRVTIRGEAGQRPELINRRLREVPPMAGDGGPSAVELAYGSPEQVAGDGTAVADLLPPAAASGSRAWAWREVATCVCHDSGTLEWESRFDVENQGRGSVNLTVPEGLRLEEVSVAGGAIAPSEFGQGGGTLVVPLPADRGRVSLVIRGTGRRNDRFGWWSVGPISCGIDLPILDREAWLLLPPGLALASGGGAGRSWAARLFNATTGMTGGGGSSGSAARSIDITAATRGGVTSAIVVRRRLIAALTMCAGGLAILAGWAAVGLSPPIAIMAVGLAGLLALWAADPWNGVARAMWWGGIIGSWAAVRWRPPPALRPTGWLRRTGIVVAIGFIGGSVCGAEITPLDPRPLRVIVLEEPDGGMALVPERLFRKLAAAEAVTAVPAVRVVHAEVAIHRGHDRWQLRLAVDADRGGSLRLPAEPGSRWLAEASRRESGSLSIEVEPGAVRLFSADGGRAELSLGFEPAFGSDGAIESAIMHLPAAATARVVFAPTDAASTAPGWQCDRSGADGPWLPAAWNGDGFDVSRAVRIRLVRPAVASDTLLAEPRAAESVNDVSWRSTECRVDASFTVGGDREIIRQLILQVDAGLRPVFGGAAIDSLGAGRYRIDLAPAAVGVRTVTASFRMPLADPVGLFELPGVWLEGVGTDQRTVRLRPEPGLEATPESSLGMTLVRPRAEDGPVTAAIWRSEVVAPAADGGGEEPTRPRIAVRRRPLPVRGSQTLLVTAAADRLGLQLDAELEAVTLPLVQIPVDLPETAVIDRLVVTRLGDAGESQEPLEIDAVWSRPTAGRLAVVVQRPDTGLFHLRIDARIPGPPPDSGRLPLVRAEASGSLPLVVSWQAVPGLTVELPERVLAVGQPVEEWIEIPAGEAGPAYRLVHEPPASEEDAPPDADLPAVAIDVGVALTDVHLAIDHRGRGWGLARFDLVAADPTLLVELPAGFRLFDVRVDGREVTAVPRGDSSWEVRLHDVTWPRTLMVLFAGTVSGPLAEGKPIRLVPPLIVGLPVTDVRWSLDLPPGYELRLADPVASLDAGGARVGEARSRRWYAEAFQAAVAAADPRERAWLEEFALARGAGKPPAGERAWFEAWSRVGAESSSRTLLDAGSPGDVTIRPVVPRDPTVAARGLASLLLAAAAMVVWAGGRRMSAAAWQSVARWWWLGCGLAWLVVLQPALPGWIMVGCGGWIAICSRPRPAAESAAG